MHPFLRNGVSSVWMWQHSQSIVNAVLRETPALLPMPNTVQLHVSCITVFGSLLPAVPWFASSAHVSIRDLGAARNP